jgi:hypothetical protein
MKFRELRLPGVSTSRASELIAIEVIAFGRASDVAGSSYAVNVRDHSVRELFPRGAAAPEHDTVTYRGCPGPKSLLRNRALVRIDLTTYTFHYGVTLMATAVS